MKRIIILVNLFLFCSMSFSQITSEPKFIFSGSVGSFNPDGKSIACEHQRKIWIINLITNEAKQVSTLAWDFRPRWSPDGKSIVFQSYGNSIKNQDFSIWIVNADGSNQHQFYPKAEGSEGDQSPFWSFDGKKIAWTHGKRLWIADKNGKNAKPLTKDPAIEYEYIVDWSRDSKTILYIRTDRYQRSDDSVGFGYQEVCLVDTNSQNQKRIDLLHKVSCAKFSQDDLSIYYTTYDNFVNKYYFFINKILLHFIKIKNCNGTSYFDISHDFGSLAFDNSGPIIEPNIYIMKIK